MIRLVSVWNLNDDLPSSKIEKVELPLGDSIPKFIILYKTRYFQHSGALFNKCPLYVEIEIDS